MYQGDTLVIVWMCRSQRSKVLEYHVEVMTEWLLLLSPRHFNLNDLSVLNANELIGIFNFMHSGYGNGYNLKTI